MTPEGRVKKDIKKILDAAGVWYYCPVSNGMGRHGIPDFICCINGRFVAIEAKAANGKATTLQLGEFTKIKAAHGKAWLVFPDTIDVLRLMVDQVKYPR